MSNSDKHVSVENILGIPVPLVVILGEKQLRMEDILNFSPGAIIEFNKASDQLLDVHINNQPVGRGEVVKVGEKFGIQIKEVKSPEETIRALGGG